VAGEDAGGAADSGVESVAGVHQRNLKTLYDAGVKIGFGTNSGANPARIAGFAEHRELKLIVAAYPSRDIANIDKITAVWRGGQREAGALKGSESSVSSVS
jgi:hypothetical protein